jgi:hypothetical protein
METQCLEINKKRIHFVQTLLKEHEWEWWMSKKQETSDLLETFTKEEFKLQLDKRFMLHHLVLEWHGTLGVQDIFFLFLFDNWCRNPTLAKCGGEAQHLEKVRIWSPPRLPNVQSSTARPKTPRIGVFLVSLERS